MELEELKKKFILTDDLEKMSVESLIEKLLPFCQVEQSGFVVISEIVRSKLTIREKILLTLVARFLANRLQEKSGTVTTISQIVTGDEL